MDNSHPVIMAHFNYFLGEAEIRPIHGKTGISYQELAQIGMWPRSY
jgi:hypothetical protein